MLNFLGIWEKLPPVLVAAKDRNLLENGRNSYFATRLLPAKNHGRKHQKMAQFWIKLDPSFCKPLWGLSFCTQNSSVGKGPPD